MNPQLSKSELEALEALFERYGCAGEESLNVVQLTNILLDLDIDSSYAPLLYQILQMLGEERVVNVETFSSFISLLRSQVFRRLFKVLFDSIDMDDDQILSEQDLVECSVLFGDRINGGIKHI